MLTRNEAQVGQQQDEIEQLRSRLAEYEKEAANEKGLTRLMTEELHTARIALGIVEVTGPGIVLEISDSTMRASDEFGGQDVYVIHDFDLLQIANELLVRRGRGRLDQRAAAHHWQPHRLLGAGSSRSNGITVGSPFVFQAIGDREKLTSALNIRDGVLDRLRVLQFPVKLTPKDSVVIPPIPVTPKYTYAAARGEEGVDEVIAIPYRCARPRLPACLLQGARRAVELWRLHRHRHRGGARRLRRRRAQLARAAASTRPSSSAGSS